MAIKNFKPIKKGSISKEGKKSPFLQGYYQIQNPHKYIGNVNAAIFRSSWELKFCKLLDNDPMVLKWGIEVESIKVKYYSPIDDRYHWYYPDFYFEKNVNGTIKKIIGEVKAKTFITMPKRPNTVTKSSMSSYNDKLKFYMINQLKFESVKNFCKNSSLEFMVFTEEFFEKLKLK